jgi:hypothetical protein
MLRATLSYSNPKPPNTYLPGLYLIPSQHWLLRRIVGLLRSGIHLLPHTRSTMFTDQYLQISKWIHTNCYASTLIHNPPHFDDTQSPISYCGTGLAWIVIEAKVGDVGCSNIRWRPAGVERAQSSTWCRYTMRYPHSQPERAERTWPVLVCVVEERTNCPIHRGVRIPGLCTQPCDRIA